MVDCPFDFVRYHPASCSLYQKSHVRIHPSVQLRFIVQILHRLVRNVGFQHHRGMYESPLNASKVIDNRHSRRVFQSTHEHDRHHYFPQVQVCAYDTVIMESYLGPGFFTFYAPIVFCILHIYSYHTRILLLPTGYSAYHMHTLFLVCTVHSIFLLG
jgi:hypothetical protein